MTWVSKTPAMLNSDAWPSGSSSVRKFPSSFSYFMSHTLLFREAASLSSWEQSRWIWGKTGSSPTFQQFSPLFTGSWTATMQSKVRDFPHKEECASQLCPSTNTTCHSFCLLRHWYCNQWISPVCCLTKIPGRRVYISWNRNLHFQRLEWMLKHASVSKWVKLEHVV